MVCVDLDNRYEWLLARSAKGRLQSFILRLLLFTVRKFSLRLTFLSTAVLCLRLHSDFLRQLVALLGTNENVNEDCVIDVDYDLAFNLYDSWKNTSVGSKVNLKYYYCLFPLARCAGLS